MLSRELTDKALDLREAMAALEGWEVALRLDQGKASDPSLLDFVGGLGALIAEINSCIENALNQLDSRLAAGVLQKPYDDYSLLRWTDARNDISAWCARQHVELASKALASLKKQMDGLKRAGEGQENLRDALTGVRLFGNIVAEQLLVAMEERRV